MTISRRGKILKLTGVIGVEDAEIIYAELERHSFQEVDLSGCEYLHSAVLQLFLMFKVPIHKYPQQPTLASWLRHSVGQG